MLEKNCTGKHTLVAVIFQTIIRKHLLIEHKVGCAIDQDVLTFSRSLRIVGKTSYMENISFRLSVYLCLWLNTSSSTFVGFSLNFVQSFLIRAV
jgi:hypothetical protein